MSLRCPRHLEVYRRSLRGHRGDDTNGYLVIPARGLVVIFSSGEGWEHASVSLKDRCPTWDELEWVKRELWSPTDVVMQLHVAEADHINTHPFCLHLWRPIDGREIPTPPKWMVA